MTLVLSVSIYPNMDKYIHIYIYIYIYIYMIKNEIYIYKFYELYIYIYIYIYCHPQTDCFDLSEFFSVAKHVGRSMSGSKPIQLYVRLTLRPLGQQAYHVG